MRLTDVQRNDLKDVVVTVRTTQENFNWLKKNKISPSLLFDESIKELRQEVENQKETEKNFVKFISPKKK